MKTITALATVCYSLLFLGSAVPLACGQQQGTPTPTPKDNLEIKRWSDALKKNPKDATAYFNRGNAYAAAEDYDDAIEDYSEAIEINPKYADAYIQRAIAGIAQDRQYSEEGEYHGDLDATPCYINRWNDIDAALKLDPKNVKALLVRGEEHLYPAEYKIALADFDAAIALDPKNTAALCDRGTAYTIFGETAKAAADSTEAIRKAEADYTEAIRIDPKDAGVYKLRAELFLIKGGRELAGRKPCDRRT